jgi:hypothetical protein
MFSRVEGSTGLLAIAAAPHGMFMQPHLEQSIFLHAQLLRRFQGIVGRITSGIALDQQLLQASAS